MSIKITKSRIASALLLACAPISAAYADDSWDWSLAPYAWLPAIGTSVTADVPPIESDSTTQFSGWAPKLGFTIPLHLEGQGDDFGILSDILYLPLSNDRNGRVFGTKSEFDAGVFELAGVWSPGPVRHDGFEVIGGLRYLWSSLDLKLVPNNSALPSGKITIDKSYADFMLGVRYLTKLNDRWGFSARADGSWGSTDGTYGATAGFTYATSNGAWVIGYKYLKLKFSSNNAEANARLYGPEFAYNFNF